MPINPAEISTIRVGELPTELPTIESKLSHEIGTDLFRCTISELIDLVNLNIGTLQYEIKTLHVNQAYIDDNFNETGLGINLMSGFHICNGNMGTPPLDGLVTVGYGTNYNVIGGFGGSKDAVVVEHNHDSIVFNTGLKLVNDTGSGTFLNNQNEVSLFSGGGNTNKTGGSGISGTNKNMQPYIILLKIMKL